jgi:hypothetical protein
MQFNTIQQLWYEQTNIEQMREETVRAKTAIMGLEKSSLHSIPRRRRRNRAVTPGANTDPDSFGGFGFESISVCATGERKSTYDETLPSMFAIETARPGRAELKSIRFAWKIPNRDSTNVQRQMAGPAAALREVIV